MAADILITLTNKETTDSFDISTGDVVSFIGVNSNADSIVKFLTQKNTIATLTVDETPTQIKAFSADFIDLTLTSDGSTETVNASRVETTYPDGSGTIIFFDDQESAWSQLKVTESQSAVRALVASASVPSPDSPGTPGVGVTAVHEGVGRDIVTTLTLTATTVDPPTAAAAEGHGHLVYTFPAGAHFHEVTYMSMALQGGGVVDADTPDVGIGSIIASGAVSVLSGTSTFEDYITGQTATDADGTATVAQTVATAGALTGISINDAADVKTLHFNYADTWAGADTLTATGTITFKWTITS